MADKILARLRRTCLALPETSEKIAWGSPTFRVRGKMFGMYLNDHHGDGVVALWAKSTPEIQEVLVAADPRRIFVPPYVGHKGWIGVRLDGTVDWDEIADHVREAYRLTAPRRLLAQLDAEPAAGADTVIEPRARRRRQARAG